MLRKMHGQRGFTLAELVMVAALIALLSTMVLPVAKFTVKRRKEAELRVLREQAAAEGKPENVQEKIVEGRLRKWLEEVVLLNQKHVREDQHGGKSIAELRTELAANTGENIVIRRFAKFQVGEA